jgi:hypothetical protein
VLADRRMARVVHPFRVMGIALTHPERSARQSSLEEPRERQNLTELLSEIRILLPGSEVFLAFLMTLPFTSQFPGLSTGQRVVYLCTFFAAIAAMTCFVVPAAYHRVARPIRHKAQFKVFANAFVVAGLVLVSIAMVLVTYLVSSVVVPTAALPAAAVVAALIAAVWWALPLFRVHELVRER